MSSTDYWLLEQLCPACQACDHAHCDPDRSDCPAQVCICREELIPDPRNPS